ncbi:serpin 2 precursor, putative, partial [Ixodes scapularis]
FVPTKKSNTQSQSCLLSRARTMRHNWRARKKDRPVLQQFSLRLYRAMSKSGSNVFVSPFGTAVALVSALAGSRGDTADQILKALGVSNEDELLHEFDSIGRALGQLSENHVGLANKMYLSTSLELADSFKEAIHRDFYAQVGIVNFQGDPTLAVKEINSWFQRVTAHKMNAIVDVTDINYLTRVLMVSTAYLRCLWLDKFSEIYTTPMPFYTDEGEVMVQTMCSRRICNYCHVERLSCRVLELPCMLDQLELLILLPDVQSDLDFIEDNILAEDVQSFERMYTRNPLDIMLPKFTLDQLVTLLEGALRDMGMQNIFDPSNADLSKMSSDANLCVDSFIHEALFETSEEGLGEASPVPSPIPADIHKFRVDRPFIFVLLHHFNHAVVFVGAVRKP